MKKINRKLRNYWLWGFIISCYIILAYIFSCIRIPYSFLKKEETDLFNNVIVTIAAGYVVTYLFVFIKKHFDRERYKLEIHDLFEKFEKVPRCFENESGLRYDKMGNEDYVSVYRKKYIEISSTLTCLLDKAYSYEKILSEDEKYHLSEIRRLFGNMDIPEDITAEEIEIYAGKLKDICKNIYILSDKINAEIQK